MILSMMLSEDGFASRLNGELDWVIWGPEMDVAALYLLEQVDMFIAGHNAFADMAHYWPAVPDSPEASPEEKALARKLCAKPKAIIGRRTEAAIWDEQLVLDQDLLRASIRRVEGQYGVVIAYGGVRTAQALIAEGLVDELQLFVSPIPIGEGHRLFVSQADMLRVFEIVETQELAIGGSRLKLKRSSVR